MPDLSKLTASQRANYHYMADALRRLEWDLHNTIEATTASRWSGTKSRASGRRSAR